MSQLQTMTRPSSQWQSNGDVNFASSLRTRETSSTLSCVIRSILNIEETIRADGGKAFRKIATNDHTKHNSFRFRHCRDGHCSLSLRENSDPPLIYVIIRPWIRSLIKSYQPGAFAALIFIIICHIIFPRNKWNLLTIAFILLKRQPILNLQNIILCFTYKEIPNDCPWLYTINLKTKTFC